jgi:Transposase, Mutator family
MNSVTFSAGKLKGEERQEVLEGVQAQMHQAVLEALHPLFRAFFQAEVNAKLGRAKGEARQINQTAREIDWNCAKCGNRDAHQMFRDGHYRRNLATGWGYLVGLKVPMLECAKCGHDVVAHWTILEKYARFWLDLEQQALFGSGLCQSLRNLRDEWNAFLGGSVGLRTINEAINQIEGLIKVTQTEPLKAIPVVVQLDGIWLTVQTQTDPIKLDKTGRKRHKRTGKRMVVLVALGLWSDGSGHREILDWDLAEGESFEAWQSLLERLVKRGLTVEAGLKCVVRDGGGGLGEAVDLVYANKVVDQRCIFHKLKNVKDNLPAKLPESEKKALMNEAKMIYRGATAQDARTALATFAENWRSLAPKAVTSLERDFEQTIAFYRLTGINLELARTTSLLERINREFRRKFRQASLFGSERGAKVVVFLQVARLNGFWKGLNWWQVSQSLWFDFDSLILNP